jgi:hypothetical protein
MHPVESCMQLYTVASDCFNPGKVDTTTGRQGDSLILNYFSLNAKRSTGRDSLILNYRRAGSFNAKRSTKQAFGRPPNKRLVGGPGQRPRIRRARQNACFADSFLLLQNACLADSIRVFRIVTAKHYEFFS